MGFFNTEVELITVPKKKNDKNDKSVARGSCAPLKSLNGYDAIREKIDEDNTLTAKKPVEQTSARQLRVAPKTKVSIGL